MATVSISKEIVAIFFGVSPLIKLYFRGQDLWEATFWNTATIMSHWKPTILETFEKPVTTKIDYTSGFSKSPDYLLYKTSGSSGEAFGYSVLREDMAINALRFSIMLLVNEHGADFPAKKLLYLVFTQSGPQYIKMEFNGDEFVGANPDSPGDFNVLQLGTVGCDEWKALAIEAMESGDYCGIVGPPSKIEQIAQHIPVGFIIETSSERTSPQLSAIMQKKSCAHLNFFHAPDGGAIFYNCKFGKMHLWHYKSYVECDGAGRIISTPIFPGETKFTRYFAGDIVENGKFECLEGPCECGREGFALSDGASLGRIMERLTVAGRTIDGIDIYAAMATLPIGKWRVKQISDDAVEVYWGRPDPVSSMAIRKLFDGASVKFMNIDNYHQSGHKAILISAL